MSEPVGGCLVLPDRRDARYPIGLVLDAPGAPAPTARRRAWEIPLPPYDQGAVPSCVGWAWAAYLTAMDPARRFDGQEVYDWAQQHDGIPGPHWGTTLRAGAEFCKQVGEQGDRITAYLSTTGPWADQVDQVSRWVLTQGPAIIQVAMLPGMTAVDSAGFLHATGRYADSTVGSHALCVREADLDARWWRVRNSWGPWWGIGGGGDPVTGAPRQGTGDALISFDDLLLPLPDLYGQPVFQGAVVATEQPVAPLPPIPPPAPMEDEMIADEIVYVACAPAGHPDAGEGWNAWSPGIGPVRSCWVSKQGPFPPIDGYWGDQAGFDVSSQPRGDQVIVTVRGGPPGKTVGVWTFARPASP